MADKVLIAYASKYGSTREIAEKIGEILSGEGITVDVLPLKDVKNLADYRAAVIGSAVYIGQWYKPTTKFFNKNQQILASLPLWIFSTGPSGKGDPVELLNGWKYPAAVQSVIDYIKPKNIAVFHGCLDISKMSGLEKWVVKRVGGSLGDFRDWDMITNWAKGIAKALK